MKEVIVKDSSAFRLRVTINDILSPATMKNVEFIQECKDKDGNVEFTSTYQFFMDNDELKILAQGLIS